MPTCKVKQNKDGIWYARPYLGRTATGKIIQPYQQFETARNEEEAQAFADSWMKTLTADGSVASTIITNLLEDYIAYRELKGISPNTAKSYSLFNRYVGRYLTGKNARDLRVIDFIKFEQKLLTSKDNGGQGLSRSSVSCIHDFLRGAYKYWVRAGICDTNPLLYVDRPQRESHEAHVFELATFELLDQQLSKILSTALVCGISSVAVADLCVAFAAWIALMTGMRCGEALALRPCDIRARLGYIHVGGTVIEEKGTKPYRQPTTKGRKDRNVPAAPEVFVGIEKISNLIRRHTNNKDPYAPLITTNGTFMRPSTVSRTFTKLCKDLGLPTGFTFHSLRHTYATWQLIECGTDLKTLSELLGHADEATTLRLYAHVLPGRTSYAAQAYGQVVNASTGLLQWCCNESNSTAAETTHENPDQSHDTKT